MRNIFSEAAVSISELKKIHPASWLKPQVPQ